MREVLKWNLLIINNALPKSTTPRNHRRPVSVISTISAPDDDLGERARCQLQLFGAPPTWFIKQLSIHSHPLPPQSGLLVDGPPSASCGRTRHPSGGGYDLRFTGRPSSSAERSGSSVLLVPPPHCLRVKLREPNMMESDFWTARRPLSFVRLEWDWKLGNRRGFQMSVTKRGPTMAPISASVEVCSLLGATKASKA